MQQEHDSLSLVVAAQPHLARVWCQHDICLRSWCTPMLTPEIVQLAYSFRTTAKQSLIQALDAAYTRHTTWQQQRGALALQEWTRTGSEAPFWKGCSSSDSYSSVAAWPCTRGQRSRRTARSALTTNTMMTKLWICFDLRHFVNTGRTDHDVVHPDAQYPGVQAVLDIGHQPSGLASSWAVSLRH